MTVWLSVVCNLTLGAAPPAGNDELHVLPPWVIVAVDDPTELLARGDGFASTLGASVVLDGSDWSGRAVATFAEALRRAPGVMLQESFGGFEPPRLSIRGSGLDSAPTSRGVALLVDGLPLTRADGTFHSGLFDPQLFPRVEIYRGSFHLALTPAVLGGAINAVTRAPAESSTVALRAEGGDVGAFRTQITAVTPFFRAAASFQRSDGWRPQSGQERTAMQLATHHALAAALDLDVSVYAATAGYEVPGPLTLSEASVRPRSVSDAVLRDRPRRDSSLLRGAAQLKSAGFDGAGEVGISWLQMRDAFRQLQPNGITDLAARAVSGHATYTWRPVFGGIDHRLLGRASATTGQDDVERFLNVSGQRGASFAAYTTRADTVALSLDDVVGLGSDLTLNVGFTALQGRRALSGCAASPALAAALDFDDLSPRAALRWSPRRRVSLHAAVSRGLEPPAFDDLVAVKGTHPDLSLGARRLVAQSAVTHEMGIRGTAGSFEWDFTLYRAAWRHEILRLADAAGLPRGAVNADRTVHEGLESSLRWQVLGAIRKLTFTITSTLGRTSFDDDPVYGCNRLAGVPPHVGGAELLYEHPGGLFAALETTWTAGSVPVDQANRLSYQGHGLGQVRIGWRSGARFLVFAGLRNLQDRRYVAGTAGVLDLARNPAGTSLFLPGTGRSFTLGLEWTP